MKKVLSQRRVKRKAASKQATIFPFLEFFAGSGLVAEGMRPYFDAVWANDVSDKKAKVYKANC